MLFIKVMYSYNNYISFDQESVTEIDIINKCSNILLLSRLKFKVTFGELIFNLLFI